MSREDPHSHADRDQTGTRESRVSVLRDLVMQRVYDVPAEEVAASIIREALTVAAPAPAPALQH